MSFSSRHPILSVILQIAVFRQRPEVLPASPFLFGLLLSINLLIGGANFLTDFNIIQSLLRMVVDLVVSLGFIHLILQAASKTNRSLQTMIAMLGISAILNLLSFPLLLVLPDPQTSIGPVGTVLYLLFFWHIAIMGHIFRCALSVSLPTGLLVSLAYVFMTITVFYALFPLH